MTDEHGIGNLTVREPRELKHLDICSGNWRRLHSYCQSWWQWDCGPFEETIHRKTSSEGSQTLKMLSNCQEHGSRGRRASWLDFNNLFLQALIHPSFLFFHLCVMFSKPYSLGTVLMRTALFWLPLWPCLSPCGGRKPSHVGSNHIGGVQSFNRKDPSFKCHNNFNSLLSPSPSPSVF